MSQDARPTLASKGCGQPCSPLLCKDRPASSREAPSVAGPSPRSRTGRRGRPAPRAAGRGLRRVRAWPLRWERAPGCWPWDSCRQPAHLDVWPGLFM